MGVHLILSHLKKNKFYFYQKLHLNLELDLPEAYVATKQHHPKKNL
jgi:hypothetical protein